MRFVFFWGLAPEKWVGECVGGGGMDARERPRCVRYRGQTTTDDDEVCVRRVYGMGGGGGNDVMGTGDVMAVMQRERVT